MCKPSLSIAVLRTTLETPESGVGVCDVKRDHSTVELAVLVIVTANGVEAGCAVRNVERSERKIVQITLITTCEHHHVIREVVTDEPRERREGVIVVIKLVISEVSLKIQSQLSVDNEGDGKERE